MQCVHGGFADDDVRSPWLISKQLHTYREQAGLSKQSQTKQGIKLVEPFYQSQKGSEGWILKPGYSTHSHHICLVLVVVVSEGTEQIGGARESSFANHLISLCVYTEGSV